MRPETDEADFATSCPVEDADRAGLPHGLALLAVAPLEPSWTSLALQLDGHGCGESTFRWAASSVEALATLRDETFDCIVVADNSAASPLSQASGKRIDAFEFVRALRTSGHDEPVIVLTQTNDDERWMQAIELECTPAVLERGWESRALLPLIQREIQRSNLKRDNHRLAVADQKRLLRERDETEHLLDRQREILHELRELVAEADVVVDYDDYEPENSSDVAASEHVCRFYDDLLRTYVMMGSGRLGAEIEQLTHLLATAGVSLRRALDMHLTQVEKLVRGLGSRSSRHVMSRADILALELMIQLGECYRRGGPGAADRAA